MTFQSLYRKHRPQRFDELLGQHHVTTALRNAVRESRVGHAYLFSGPRGTGKTTSARILAKSLNCTDLSPDGEPCGRCDSCVEIARGSSMDVIELDAASNNGVAEMRSLLERVAFRSAGGRRRVYIVDEVHMLSTAASNALLKTLEEPPDHVVFVLATTEPEKVLPTIRSRTQHFEFRLLGTEEIAAYLADVAGQEEFDVDSETLHLVARRGAGSVRDALSLLDQAMAFGDGPLGSDDVRGLFEANPFERVATLVDAVASEDVAAALGGLQVLLDGGADPRRVADDLLRHLRNAYLVTASQGRARVDALEEELERLEAQGRAMGAAAVERAIETLGEAAVDMRRAPDPRLVLEVALVRLARRDTGTRAEVLLDRVERLERALDELRGTAMSAPAPTSAPAAPAPTSAPAAPAAGRARPPSAPTTAAPAAPGDEGVTAGASADQPAPPADPADPAARPALGGVRARQRGAAAPTEPAQRPAAPAAGAARQPTAPEPAPPAGRAAPAEPAEPAAPAERTEPTEAPPASSAPTPDGALDFDDVKIAWAEALEQMRGVLKAVAREAQPVSVDGTTVILGLPQGMARHRPRLDKEASTVAKALGAALGGRELRVKIEEHEGFLDDASTTPAGAGATAARDAGTGADDPPETVGPDDLEPEALGSDVEDVGVDSVDRLVDAFGATVEGEDEGQ